MRCLGGRADRDCRVRGKVASSRLRAAADLGRAKCGQNRNSRGFARPPRLVSTSRGLLRVIQLVKTIGTIITYKLSVNCKQSVYSSHINSR